MLYLYKNKTPNIENGKYYYFTDFQNYLTELGTPYLSITKNSYQINNDVAIVETQSNNADVDAITYIIDYDTNYYRCYHVESAMVQSGYMYFNISVDYWGSFIAKCSLENMVVTRCNRNVGTGVFDTIEQTKSRTITNYYKTYTRSELMIVYYVLIKTGSSSLFQNTSSTTFKIFYNSVYDLTHYGLFPDIQYKTIIKALEQISGIYKMHINSTNYDVNVVKAFIVPSELISRFENTTTYQFDSNAHGTSYTFYAQGEVLCDFKSISFSNTYIISPDINYNRYLGTQNKGIEIPRITSDIYPIINCVVSQDDLRVLVQFGDKSEDITENFSVTITSNDGNLTTQEKINKTLSTMTRVISGLTQISSGGLGFLTGGMELANSMSNIMGGEKTNGGFTNGGDGISTFFGFYDDNGTLKDTPIAPFKIMKYLCVFIIFTCIYCFQYSPI